MRLQLAFPEGVRCPKTDNRPPTLNSRYLTEGGNTQKHPKIEIPGCLYVFIFLHHL